jgi:hypothetical protein
MERSCREVGEYMSLSKFKVLLLNVNREGWHSGNMIYDMRCIQHACDTVIYGPGWPNYKTTSLTEIIEQIYGDGKPDLIYSYFTPNEKVGDVYMKYYKIPEELRYFPTGFNEVKGVRKVFAISDFWSRNPKQYSADLKGAEFDHIVSCFTPPYANKKHFYPFFDKDIRDRMSFYAHPRCIDRECYKDYDMPQKYDIVSVGATGRFYPLRTGMRNGLAHHGKERGVNFKNYGYCGSNFKHNGFVRDEYAKAINESKMLLSCGGKYNLVFNKIFEAMGCNTVYVGDQPYGHEELGLVDGETYIEVDKTNYLDKITHYAKRDDEIKRIAKNAKELFLERHTIEARAKDFVNLLGELKI